MGGTELKEHVNSPATQAPQLWRSHTLKPTSKTQNEQTPVPLHGLKVAVAVAQQHPLPYLLSPNPPPKLGPSHALIPNAHTTNE